MSRKHHVNLTFADDAGRTRSITMKVASRKVTAPLIREAVSELEMSENAALLSVSWLGKMTDQEYSDGIPHGERQIVKRALRISEVVVVLIALIYMAYMLLQRV